MCILTRDERDSYRPQVDSNLESTNISSQDSWVQAVPPPVLDGTIASVNLTLTLHWVVPLLSLAVPLLGNLPLGGTIAWHLAKGGTTTQTGDTIA